MPEATQEAYEKAVLDAVEDGLHSRLSGHRMQALGPPDRVAERMLATVPMAHPWDEQIGPFYDTPGVVRLLDVSKQAVFDRVRRRTLLATNTSRGRALYPIWQFDGSKINPAVSRILTLFRDVPVDGWAIASWFTTPAAVLDGATPISWLRAGNDVTAVASLAMDTARRWAR